MSKRSSELSEEELKNMEKVLELATKAPSFRKALRVDPAEAIDKRSSKLGFDSSKIPKVALELLSSLTDKQLEGLSVANKKAHKANLVNADMPF